VGWTAPGGRSGTAAMNWRVDSGAWSTRNIRSHMDWTARVPLVSGQNVISVTAVDVKGLATTRSVTVSGDAKAHAARAHRKAKRKAKRCKLPAKKSHAKRHAKSHAKAHAKKARKAKGHRAKQVRCARARKQRA
jgi:hypothetical protein